MRNQRRHFADRNALRVVARHHGHRPSRYPPSTTCWTMCGRRRRRDTSRAGLGRCGSTPSSDPTRSPSASSRSRPTTASWSSATATATACERPTFNREIDTALGPTERLTDRFPGVRFELGPGMPDADGRSGTGTDGVRVGSARILTMSPDGTASSGTLYIRGRRGQYAVRVLGATGRTRMLQWEPGTRSWISR